ncbi:MAG: chorismate-binding protein [Aliidongia sp.]
MELIDAVEASPARPLLRQHRLVRLRRRRMDSSIVIRTLTITPELVIAQAGGGIVADSDPAARIRKKCWSRSARCCGAIECPTR